MVKHALAMLAFIFLSLNFINATLSLERIDAIADLCAVATSYFSDAPYESFESPEAKEMSSFAWSLSEMWDENESALYVLTRLAKFVDEKDEEGNLSTPARIIRTYSQQSDARKVYITTVEGSYERDDQIFKYTRPKAKKDDVDDELEMMYLKGHAIAADARVSKLIQTRWNSLKQAVNDLEISAKNGNFNLLSGLIKVGSKHRALKLIAPEVKAGIASSFLNLNKLNLDPVSAKWLLTMDTYREDQLKLVKAIEKLMKKGRQMSFNSIQSHQQNDLAQLIGEVVEISQKSGNEEYNEKYFEDISGVNLSANSEQFYKKMQIKKRGLEEGTGVVQKAEKKGGEKAVVYNEKIVEKTTPKVQVDETKTQKNAQNNNLQTASDQNTKTLESIHTNTQENNSEPDNYFEEKEKREEEIDKLIYDNNSDPLYDNDGVYDADEQKGDQVTWIVVCIMMGLIVLTALGSYAYLRIRRARRNRTMVIVDTALEGTNLNAA